MRRAFDKLIWNAGFSIGKQNDHNPLRAPKMVDKHGGHVTLLLELGLGLRLGLVRLRAGYETIPLRQIAQWMGYMFICGPIGYHSNKKDPEQDMKKKIKVSAILEARKGLCSFCFLVGKRAPSPHLLTGYQVSRVRSNDVITDFSCLSFIMCYWTILMRD